MKPEVQAKYPEEKVKDNYQMLEAAGVNIYIAKNMEQENKNIKFLIDVTGFWFLKKLYLSKIESF